MFKKYMEIGFKNLSFVIILAMTLTSSVLSQDPTSSPTPPDDTIKIFTEEVHLNVTAQTSHGKFVSTLKPDDLLIVEEGTPQTIESMKKLPASVLVLLDTGGNLNFAKNLDLTRLTAKILVNKLSSENPIAVMQSYNKIETVADWTNNRDSVQDALDKKLFSGNRSRFADAVKSAVEIFKSRPLKNRHLVFIGDGLDSFADENERRQAIQNLLAANITIHVIAYNRMEDERAKHASRNFQIGKKKETPRMPDYILEQILETMPSNMKDGFRRFVKAERLFVIRLDRKAVKLARQKRENWIKSEAELQSLAEDTGGMFHAPEQLETMWKFAAEVAAAIGSQYVITYISTKPFAESPKGESRKVRVSTHCDGVQIRSRQKIIVP